MVTLSSFPRLILSFLPLEWQRDLERHRHRTFYDTLRAEVKTASEGDSALTYTLRSFDEHRCIYVHVPKAGGNSIAQALFGNAAGGHSGANRYRMIFGRDFWRYFKFAFVRNPYTRLVSAYEYLCRGGHPAWPQDRRFRDEVLGHYADFEDFVLRWLTPGRNWPVPHFQPQTEFLTLDGNLAMDFIGRFERIGEDFVLVAERLRIRAGLPHLNKTGGARPSLESYFFNGRVTERVQEVYAEDFRLLRYPVAVPHRDAMLSCNEPSSHISPI